MSAPACELCGLPVGTVPFVLRDAAREYLFCCEGCRGIYEMLNDIKSPSAGAANHEEMTPKKERS